MNGTHVVVVVARVCLAPFRGGCTFEKDSATADRCRCCTPRIHCNSVFADTNYHYRGGSCHGPDCAGAECSDGVLLSQNANLRTMTTTQTFIKNWTLIRSFNDNLLVISLCYWLHTVPGSNPHFEDSRFQLGDLSSSTRKQRLVTSHTLRASGRCPSA